ncbi:hypothetical protein B0A55_02961 [Friedmanniomyces simplex]|uniref:Ribosome biogenesis protein SLX9 n=1 Tax=Friedmanniomyces simplex TaxID=329884 RepID=A0A4U0XZ03_9PEZI|nr:hypothetical protein B0A55_02961 [Friedmanniomyces simplex]
MAPLPPSRHSRAVRSAKNPRGIYAPPLATEPNPTSSTTPTTPATDDHEAEEAQAEAGAGAFADFRVNKKDKRSMRHATLLAKVRDSGIRKGSGVTSGRVGSMKTKRRRPGKKLAGGDMEGLGDALPDAGTFAAPAISGADEGGEEEEGWEGLEDTEEDGEYGEGQVSGGGVTVPNGLRKASRRSRQVGGGLDRKIVMKSIRNRPGAQKRKRVMEDRERERFGRNLAGMVGSQSVIQQQEREGETAVEKGGEGEGRNEATGVAVSEAERWVALRKFIGSTMERSDGFKAKA